MTESQKKESTQIQWIEKGRLYSVLVLVVQVETAAMIWIWFAVVVDDDVAFLTRLALK